MSLLIDTIVAGINKINFQPVFYNDNKYKVWCSALSDTTCRACYQLHGKLYLPEEAPPRSPKKHERCVCVVIWSKSVKKGTATFDGAKGIDVLICNGEPLPSQYLTKQEAKKLGWKPALMNLQRVTDNGVIGGDSYKNRDGKLPTADGRVWYEADINYTGGIRNGSRIVYSNDGLVFVA